MAEEYVLLAALAHEWGIDKSTARKYAKRHGFDFVRTRGSDPTHQLVLALSKADAELLREIRAREGYQAQLTSDYRAVENGRGIFYVVQVIPDVDPSRVKLGYASSAPQRLESYRTISPTARLVKTWACRPTWERAAIDSLTALDCELIGGEVYTCRNLDALLQRGDAFFSLMPSLPGV
jgi:hypothetical protein